jgi:hypothetical protein
LHGRGGQRAQQRVARQPAELEQTDARMGARRRRLPDAGAGRAAHGDAMRAARQSHQDGGGGQR